MSPATIEERLDAILAEVIECWDMVARIHAYIGLPADELPEEHRR